MARFDWADLSWSAKDVGELVAQRARDEEEEAAVGGELECDDQIQHQVHHRAVHTQRSSTGSIFYFFVCLSLSLS